MDSYRHGVFNKKIGSGRGNGQSNKKLTLMKVSVGLNLVLLFWALLLLQRQAATDHVGSAHGRDVVWNGGHPTDAHKGSCWCSEDSYCMCTPSLAIDAVIVSGDDPQTVWLVRRQDTDMLATMGGFVQMGETTEDAVLRELNEEMGVTDVERPPALLGMYSDPQRDNRRHTVSAVYIVYLPPGAKPKAGDDAKEVHPFHLDDIESHQYFADHRTILLDYRNLLTGDQPLGKSKITGFSSDIRRSTCAQISVQR